MLAACGPSTPQMVQQCGINPATQQQSCVMVPANPTTSHDSSGALWGLGGFLLGRATAPSNTPQYHYGQPSYGTSMAPPTSYQSATNAPVQPTVNPSNVTQAAPAFQPKAAANTATVTTPNIPATVTPGKTAAALVPTTPPASTFKPVPAAAPTTPVVPSFKPSPATVTPTFKAAPVPSTPSFKPSSASSFKPAPVSSFNPSSSSSSFKPSAAGKK